MKQINISPEVAIKEAEALAEFWRNRALAHSQMSFVQQIRIKELEELIPESEEVPIIKSEGTEHGN